MSATKPPTAPLFQEIVRVIGKDDALALARERGGSAVSLPTNLPADHWLCDLIGQDRAKALCDRFSGGCTSEYIMIPLGPYAGMNLIRENAIADIRDGMLSFQKIALKHGVTTRSVSRWARSIRAKGTRS